MKRPCMVVLAVLVVSVASARSNVIFTVNAVSEFTELGYSAGQSLTFQFVVNGDFSSQGSDFTLTENSWVQNSASDEAFLESVTGTGLTGTYVATAYPNSSVQVSAAGLTIDVVADTYEPYGSIGLNAPDGLALGSLVFGMSAAVAWTFPGYYVSPDTYFTSFQGSLGIVSDASVMMTSIYDLAYKFPVTSVSVTVVPEPSVWGLCEVAVLAMAGLYWLRRRPRLER